MLENTETSQVQHKYLKNMKNASYNLLDVINDILDFSKIEAGQVEIERIEFSLDQLLDKVSNLLMPKAAGKGLTFHVKKDVNIPDRLISDPTRIEQILINLVNNGIKFTSAGSVNIIVSLEEEGLNQSSIRFTVTDTGIGMSSEQQQHLFKPFHQLDSSVTRKYGGTGLGLSISRKMIHLLDGDIFVKSEPGVGSEFYFIIPMGINHSEPVVKRYPDFRSVKTLVYDTDQMTTGIIGGYLESFGISHQVVDSRKGAVEALLTGEYSLMIMDMNMPEVHCFDFVSTYARGVDVIFITNQVVESQFDEAIRIGVKHIVVKPIISSILYNTLVQMYVNDNEKIMTETKLIKHKMFGKILLVEDNEVNQLIEREILEQQGMEVIVAEDGLKAVNLVKQGTEIDLILMDIHMPVMDGYEATKLIRKLDHQTPILAMTAVSFNEIEEKCQAIGFTGYVSKPIQPDELMMTIQKHLNQMRSREDIENNSRMNAMILDEVAEQRNQGNKQYIDRKQGLMRVGNNEKLYYEVLAKFYDDTASTQDKVSHLIHEEDLEAAQKLVHKIKGTSGNVGAVYLFQSARTLMDVLKKNFEVDLGPYIWEYENDLNSTLAELSQILQDEGMMKDKSNRELLEQNSTSSEAVEPKKDSKIIQEDEQLLMDEMKQLLKLLEHADLDAVSHFNQMKEQHAMLGDDWRQVSDFMDSYQFAKAAEILQKML